MKNFKNQILVKKNIIALVLLGIMILAIPVTVYLVQQKQIFKPKATAAVVPSCGPNSRITLTVPAIAGPSATIFGPTSSGIDDNLTYTASGTNLKNRKIQIYSAYTTGHDLTQTGSWSLLAETNCGNNDSCSVNKSFVPTAAGVGSFYLAVNVRDAANDQILCSGNPGAHGSPCGSSDSLTLVVNPPAATATPTPTSPSLSASISGPTSAGVDDNLTYTATANGSNIGLVQIYTAYTTGHDLTQEGSWSLLAETTCDKGSNNCSASRSFVPTKAGVGSFYMIVNVRDYNGHIICSGNPVTPTLTCGGSDRVILTVQ